MSFSVVWHRHLVRSVWRLQAVPTCAGPGQSREPVGRDEGRYEFVALFFWFHLKVSGPWSSLSGCGASVFCTPGRCWAFMELHLRCGRRSTPKACLHRSPGRSPGDGTKRENSLKGCPKALRPCTPGIPRRASFWIFKEFRCQSSRRTSSTSRQGMTFSPASSTRRSLAVQAGCSNSLPVSSISRRYAVKEM